MRLIEAILLDALYCAYRVSDDKEPFALAAVAKAMQELRATDGFTEEFVDVATEICKDDGYVLEKDE